MTRKPVLRALVSGTAIGALVLGVVGRIAMRGYALVDEQEPYFTLMGSMTVLMLGAIAGAATGLLLWLAGRLFPSRPLPRALMFWAGLVLLTWRVMQPLSAQRVEVFGPLAVAHGVVLMLSNRPARRTLQSST